MGKNRGGHISEKQLRMIELRAEKKTYSEIGSLYGMSVEGVRVNVRVAARYLEKYGLAALPPGCTTN